MTIDRDGDTDWTARVAYAGIPLELLDSDPEDDELALLEAMILRAARDARLSDEDLFRLMTRFWVGRSAPVDWPPQASMVARRCATILASQRPCELRIFSGAPSGNLVRMARNAIVEDLRLTPGELLGVVAEHWEEIASIEMPVAKERTLLAFAEHVLLEPVIGACVLIWSVLDSPTGEVGEGPIDLPTAGDWDGWSPVAVNDWNEVVHAELARLGQPAQRVPTDGDEAAAILAAAHAALLAHGELTQIAASIVRTCGWPGDTKLIDELANRAIELAQVHIAELDAGTDHDELVDSVQHRLMPPVETAVRWVRDPSFGTLSDPTGCASTGAEMLHQAADWLTWSLAHTAVNAVAAHSGSPPSSRP